MNRDGSRVLAAVGSLLVLLCSYAAPSASTTTSSEAAISAGQPPNVILFLVDDATVEDINYMPDVQRLLVNHGTTFAHAYVPFPQCCPARATILTGRYPHNTHVLDNTPPLGGLPSFDDSNTIATYLDPSYTTSLIGKYLNGGNTTTDTRIPPGWGEAPQVCGRSYTGCGSRLRAA